MSFVQVLVLFLECCVLKKQSMRVFLILRPDGLLFRVLIPDVGHAVCES
jgi:hypothetical protein